MQQIVMLYNLDRCFHSTPPHLSYASLSLFNRLRSIGTALLVLRTPPPSSRIIPSRHLTIPQLFHIPPTNIHIALILIHTIGETLDIIGTRPLSLISRVPIRISIIGPKIPLIVIRVLLSFRKRFGSLR